jgi:aldose 1-epimerase
MSVYAPDRNGVVQNIVAGFEEPAAYASNPWYFGCIVGRYANRIATGRFTLDGSPVQLSVNNDGNHLHGGFEGFDKKVWNLVSIIREDDYVGAEFEHHSKDGEEGYPGNLTVKVRYLLNQDNQLSMECIAIADKRTPVSFTNHSYFNLTGFEQPSIGDHLLYVNALQYTEKNGRNTPTGMILPLAGTALDFSAPGKIGERLAHFPKDMGLDHNYVISRDQHGAIVAAATLEDRATGRVLRIYTDQPGLQVYTANYWDGSITGQQGKPYLKHGAVALETQAFPDSPNHSNFPDTIMSPGEEYRTVTIYEFGVQ